MRIDFRLALGITALSLLLGSSLLTPTESAAADEKSKPQLVTVDDYFRLGDVGSPRISPDGRWIAYTVSTQDLEADDSSTRIWMMPAAGGKAIPLSAEGESSSSPRWSPDGKYLAFLSSRNEGKAQVWTLFREGGEAVKRTNTAQEVGSFAWSPDGKKMLLVLKDPKAEELEAKRAEEQGETFKKKTPPPWVVTRQQFKMDYVGYLDSRRTHLYVFDLATEKIAQITSGDFDDSQPAWSPDGKRIAFVSNRTVNPDDNYNTDIWVVAADGDKPDTELRQITTNPGPDGTPSWSPDGSRIAHTSNIETDVALYGTNHLAVS